jgi:hypothetical protein
MLVLHGAGRPTIRLQITNCRRLDGPTYEVYGTQGGLRAGMSSAEWEWFDPEAAPQVSLVREPLCKPDGTPSYCSDPLEWNRDGWQAPEGFDTFRAMVDAYYTMLHRTLTEGAPLEITPQQVRRQIAVIEECRRQNPHITRTPDPPTCPRRSTAPAPGSPEAGAGSLCAEPRQALQADHLLQHYLHAGIAAHGERRRHRR